MRILSEISGDILLEISVKNVACLGDLPVISPGVLSAVHLGVPSGISSAVSSGMWRYS